MRFFESLLKSLTLIITLMVSGICLAQNAWFEPAEIDEGDTTVLIVELQASGFTMTLEGLDTSVLEKDFEIINTSSKIMTQMDGSNVVTKNHWEIELLPLKAGKLEIPPMDLKGRLTPRLVLIVNPQASGLKSASDQKVFIRVSAEPENPFLGQQTNIVVKLYHNIRIVNGTLSEPEATNADVYRIGKDISYSQTVNGQQYDVLERSFALFPNSLGEMQVLSVTFRGQVDAGSKDSSSSYSSFLRQVKQIKRFGNDLKVNVKDIPASFTGKFWLPANDLRISEQWSDQGADLQIGDSVSREIKLIADGLPAESLPEGLMDSNNNGLNVYPDKVSRINQDIGKKLIGRVEQKYALIMSKAGYLDLPELKIKWWDVDEDIEKETVLGARTLIVNGDTVQQGNQGSTDQILQTTETQILPDSTVLRTNYWQWIALIILGLWLLTLLLWFRSKAGKAEITQTQITSSWNRKVLEQACRSNNPVQARNQLIAWAKELWPEEKITGLYQLRSKVQNFKFENELNKLDAVLFSDKREDWSGVQLLESFTQEQKTIKGINMATSQQCIPPLYA